MFPNYDTDSETHSDKQVDVEVLSQIMQEKINELKKLVKPGQSRPNLHSKTQNF
jgi:hypothetical protein